MFVPLESTNPVNTDVLEISKKNLEKKKDALQVSEGQNLVNSDVLEVSECQHLVKNNVLGQTFGVVNHGEPKVNPTLTGC